MTILKYILSTGVCTTGELLSIKKVDPDGYNTLVKWAREQAANEAVEITEK